MAEEPAKIVRGAAVSSAMEQSHRFFRRRKNRHQPLSHCENCGAQLHGRWCAQCGQPAIDYRRSLRHVIVDLLNEFLNWDSKFFGTIALLIVKPSRLTNDFLSGKRVRYVHPLRLYLLASILFFFAVNYWAKAIHLEARQLTPEQRARVEADLQKQKVSPQVRAEIERALDAHSSGPTPAAESPDHAAPNEKEAAPPPPSAADQSASAPFERWIEERAKEKIGEHGTKMDLVIRTLISNLPYMMLCCIPLFAVVLKVLYVPRRILYIDHLVYALHIHTFAYVSVILIVLTTIALSRLASGLLTGWIIALLWGAFVAQIFLSIRRVYRQSWFITVLKFFAGGFVYLVVLFVALAVTFVITVILPAS